MGWDRLGQKFLIFVGWDGTGINFPWDRDRDWDTSHPIYIPDCNGKESRKKFHFFNSILQGIQITQFGTCLLEAIFFPLKITTAALLLVLRIKFLTFAPMDKLWGVLLKFGAPV